jgi:beta-glucosidase
MCSYNRVNNSYGCANSKALNGILKTELGFQGWVVSDWGAQHAGAATALAGMDVAMPYGDVFWGTHLTDAVTNGSVPENRVDDMVIRWVLYTLHLLTLTMEQDCCHMVQDGAGPGLPQTGHWHAR